MNKNKEVLISIIIPIYNVGEYISRCFESIYTQNIADDEFEIIAINDGSTDYSSEEVKSFKSAHNNIKLIEQENMGVSVARNVGIVNANGKYVLFVDPDDSLLPNSLRILSEYLNNVAYNIISLLSFNNLVNESYRWLDIFESDKTYDCLSVLNKGYVRGSVCGVAFLKDFIDNNQLRFIDNMKNGEDTAFFFMAMYYSCSLTFKDIKCYNVIGRERSLSKTYNSERISASVNAIENVNKKIFELKHSPILEFLRYRLVANTIFDAVLTKSVSYNMLVGLGLKKYCNISVEKIEFQKYKILLLKHSFRLYYIMIKFFR